jgi:hypothetical protein
MSSAIFDPRGMESKLTRLFRYLAINVVVTYLIGAIFYADEFLFWQHAFSELGTTFTLQGTPNLISSMIMTLGMFISGRLLLEIARTYPLCLSQPHTRLKSSLMYVASLGSFISIFPNNLYHTLHSIGSACCIGGIFLLDLLILREYIASQKPIMAYILMGLLTMSVFSYAITYFMDLPIKQATQKICVINLLLILYQAAPNHQRLPSSLVFSRLN